jgi:3-phenylpropionate/trans-cinnamate dioxygenase ferredoxin reductase component
MTRKASLSVVPRPTYVIVGAGQAGAQAATTLREHGFTGRIVLLGAEPHVPYMRPPLSKRFLGGDTTEDQVWLRGASYYAASDIELKLGVRVVGIDAAAGQVHLGNGLRLGYDKLLIATGARARKLTLPGSTGPNIHYLRRLDDAKALREAIVPGVRLAIIGGGYIGLEVAATAVLAGARVRVLEREERVLARVTTPPISRFFAEAHRARGVDIRCGVRVSAFEGTDRLEAIACDGARFEADLALVGIGSEPDIDLAREAGLACDDGIVVDAHCRTTDPAIYAAGDCTRHPSRLLGRAVRLESVQNAVDQASVAARNMCGDACAYDKVPWFWSQQYDYKLQTAGVSEGHDEVLEQGDRAGASFALLYRRRGVLIGADAVNLPGAFLAARRDIGARFDSLPRVADRVA